MDWYQALTAEQRKRFNKRRARKQLLDRHKMTADEREAMRTKWREQKQRQRKAA